MEERVHRGQIGEGELQRDHRERADDDPRVGEEADGKHGTGEAAAVEQIEQLDHDKEIDRDGASLGHARATLLFPMKERETASEHDQCDEQDAELQPAGEDRRLRIARRAVHDLALLWLEDEHQPEQDGGGHVDPEDLHGQDRQRGAGENRGENDEALAEVRWQGPDDELGEVVENAAP